MIVKYTDLSDYEKELINKCVIPHIHIELEYVPYVQYMNNYYYRDVSNSNKSQQDLQKIQDRIKEFLLYERFLYQKNSGYLGVYDKAIELKKAGSIEKYYERLDLLNNNELNKIANTEQIEGTNTLKGNWWKRNKWWFIPAITTLIISLIVGYIILRLSINAHHKGDL
jgi:hypothetical protein